ncbi:MAG: coenzyme F420-0:L-glutamate ligase [Candidatus Thorarchaeota archaeon]|nr:coenzyme F420-0:L-glutamate ligase [Candidatus Thorarchaeota archaeon]
MGFPHITRGQDLGSAICDTIRSNRVELMDGDVLVVTHKVVSIAEDAVREEGQVQVSERAKKIAACNGMDPVKVEVALRDSVEVLRETPVLITRIRSGLITDYSGVDRSNAPPGCLVLLPTDPDQSARRIQERLKQEFNRDVAVIVSDTQGRPWRRGAVNLAIGVSGMSPFTVNAGRTDLYGRTLKSSLVCIADELSSAAELLTGQADEGIPVVLIRGVRVAKGETGASGIIRPMSENLFR